MKRVDLRGILPATARQRLTITRLCIARGVRFPVEETPMTMGEAGREIRAQISKLTIYKRTQTANG